MSLSGTGFSADGAALVRWASFISTIQLAVQLESPKESVSFEGRGEREGGRERGGREAEGREGGGESEGEEGRRREGRRVK